MDQIWFRLCDIKLLREETGERTDKVESLQVAATLTPDKDGYIRGRAEDGTPIKAKIGGKSLARRLMEEEERRVKAEKKRKKAAAKKETETSDAGG